MGFVKYVRIAHSTEGLSKMKSIYSVTPLNVLTGENKIKKTAQFINIPKARGKW